MLGALSLEFLALRVGLALRRARRLGARKPAGAYRRHLRLAKPALGAAWLGFAGGLASALWLRGWEPLASAHGLAALVSLGLLTATGVVGRRLEAGRSRAHDAHAALALGATLAGAVSFVTGFVLLP